MNSAAKKLGAVAVTTAVIAGWGCSPSAPTSTAQAPAATANAPPIELKPIDRQAYDALIAAERGKVVLVDFWATWCMPCVAQLPHTAELARRHATNGLATITVSMDDADAAAAAGRVLSERAGGAELAHYISSLGGGPKAMEAFEITSGAVPHYKLYDRGGKLRHTFETDPTADKPFTPTDIDAAVSQLLDEKAPQ